MDSFEQGGTSEAELLRALHGLLDGQSAPTLIHQQNAAVVVTRQHERLVFETFELSPSNEAVVSTKGRLTRSIPGPTVALDTEFYPKMLQVIAETLSAMSHGVMPGMQPVIVKAEAKHDELNDTTDPKAWLERSDHGKEAAVFVNESDELCVVDRKDRVDLLQTSPYYSRLDICLVFLDERHTRETDLKLPGNYRAAVTLGVHLTKDRLV